MSARFYEPRHPNQTSLDALLEGTRQDTRKQSSEISSIVRRFHGHGLIAKISRTRRWKVTL